MNGWRVLSVQDSSTFLRDQIKLFMAYKDDKGLSAVAPLVLELGEPIPDHTLAEDIAPTVIPYELAEQLFTQLGHILLGVTDSFTEITRLRRELNVANHRIDNLINGIGRLGAEVNRGKS